MTNPFVERIRRDNAEEDKALKILHEKAYAEAFRLGLAMGKIDPTLVRVILYGSALPDRPFRADSDIDLAVVGGNLPLLERLAVDCPFKVDIVSLADVRPGIKARIEAEGIEVYAAPEK